MEHKPWRIPTLSGKNFQKDLKNQSLQSTCSPNRILDLPWTASYAIENNLTVEQLPLKFLVQFLKIFCDSKLKVHEVIFRSISVKKTSVLFGIFIRNKPNGRVEDVMVVSQKISVSSSEASSTRESAINVTVCSFLSGFFFPSCVLLQSPYKRWKFSSEVVFIVVH